RGRDPENPFVWVTLAYLHSALGNHELAVEAYQAAIRLKPDFAEAYGGLGAVYIPMCRPAEAVEAFKTAIRLKPDYAEAYYGLGAAYLGLGKRAEALRACEALQRLDPAEAEELRALIDGR
ncbi:MAG: tetratricopeptide repeat protein, partial [Phycisphaerae bacterium]